MTITIIRNDNLTIGAGVDLNGNRNTVSYPIHVHDCSGQDNDHIFNGIGLPNRSDLQDGQNHKPPSYPDSSFKPHFDVATKSPRGNAGE
jgi:hypothetical protein